MRPLFDAEEARAVDRWAIEEQGVAEAELMEAAGTALAEAVAGLAPQGPVRVLCGKGNNGGDGLVAARRLGEMGFEVEALEVFEDELPADLDAWLAGSGAVVDAIFGTGFAGSAARTGGGGRSRRSTAAAAPVVACDIASGVDASTGEVEGAAVEASTYRHLSRAPSSATGSRPARRHTGELVVAPIGIPDGAPVEPAGGGDRRSRCSAWRRAAAPRSTKFSSGQVVGRRRLARADRRRADVLAGGDPGRRRLRDGRRARRPRAGLRGGASRR